MFQDLVDGLERVAVIEAIWVLVQPAAASHMTAVARKSLSRRRVSLGTALM